ncbi:MAG: hypothetical protein GXC94_00875 [Comamonadaceae bacterium]|nr:hypothetical protein [Comamonadaceae bacterium]
MLLNLNDPDSIVTWWTVLPDRHDAYLAHKLRVSPEFAPAINEARRRIAVRPELANLLPQAMQRRRDEEALQAERTAHLTSLRLRHMELAAA